MSESTLIDLEKRLEHVEKNGKKATSWWISPLTTVIILLVGLGVQWGMTTLSIDFLEQRVDKLEQQTSVLMIDQAKSSEFVKAIKEDVSEIKQDVKDIKNSSRRHR